MTRTRTVKMLPSSTALRATKLAGHISKIVAEEKDLGCQHLILEWALEKFWADKLQPSFGRYKVCWQWLIDAGHTSYHTSISYGDLDYSIWAESKGHKEEDGYPQSKVIISICHCAARDDNITVFVINDEFYAHTEFHIRTCGARSRGSWNHRQKSLASFRKQEFRPTYGDARDTGYGLSYSKLLDLDGKVDSAYSCGGTVYWSYDSLVRVLNVIEDVDGHF